MVGEVLNERYRIERRLGGGSQAEVFLATDAHMERQVAIKIWKPEGGFTVDEFLREAKLLARFGAPHFVTIHEHAATIDQRPFFVLEYLQGETLQDLSTPLTAQEIRRCVRDICVGMQKAHDEGVVHRDLKPSNIMLVNRGTRSERYVILDLGIAKITDTKNWRRTLADATMAGAGTLLYMSPEQCNGNPIDQRTDVYAFGCLLFLLLVQEEPFAHKAGSHLSVLNAILNEPPRRLAEVRPDGVFPEELEQLVQDCLAKKPDDRPVSMTEVESRFDQCFSDEGFGSPGVVDGGQSTTASGIKTRRPGGSSTVPHRRPKRRLVPLALAALVVVAAGGLAFFLQAPQPEAKIPAEPIVKAPVPIAPKPTVAVPVPVPTPVAKPAPPAAPRRRPEETSGSQSVAKTPVRVEPKPAVVVPAVVVPVPKPAPPLQINDDRYFVVRNRSLKADDPTGKDKDQNNNGVLANDGLPAGKPYEIELVGRPKFGELKLNGDGTFTYTPAVQPNGDLVRADSFKYRVRTSAKDPWSEPATVRIAIRPFSDEEEAAIKRIVLAYGDPAIRKDENPPAVQVDFSHEIVNKRVRDESLNILDGLVEVLHELRLDSQPITDRALDHLGRFDELRILSLAGTDVSQTGISKLPSFKNLSEVDLSDTLVTEQAVAALVADRAQKVPLHVVRDGALDRLRNLGVVITAQNDATLGRYGFAATIPRSDQFQKFGPLLKVAPRLIAIVLSKSDVNDELLTENWVRQIKSLKLLDLRETVVSPQRVALLRKQFPGLRIEWALPREQLRSIGSVKVSAADGVSIDLSHKKVDARTWTLLSQVDKLTALNLSGVAIDDVGFERLVQLATLRDLILQETRLGGQQVLEICKRIESLVSLDVRNSAIAGDKIVLRALRAELQSHDRAKATIRPEPVDAGPELLTAPFDESAAGRARAEWAAYLNTPEQMPNSLGMKLQLIPPGEFRMGSEETYLELVEHFPNVREAEEENPVSRLGLASARPQHTVRITKPFYLGAYEVTNGQFKKFVNAAAPKAGAAAPKAGPAWRRWGIEINEQAPVVDVSWNDAVAFCDWLSRTEGKTYRLPTEAEWEYACRGGTNTRYWNGDAPERLQQIANVRDMAAQKKGAEWQNTPSDSSGLAAPGDVGRYPANNFGLYDMYGNAAEWCSDWFSTSFYKESPQADPTGPSAGALHVVRGGSSRTLPLFCRSAHRNAGAPAHRSNTVGFRVVCVGTKPPWPPVLPTPAPQPAGAAPGPLVAPFKEEEVSAARKAWARYSQIQEQGIDSAGVTLVLIPPGEFMMGSTPEQIAKTSQFEPKFKKESANHEQPLHRVRIGRPFYLAAHEVTRGQFARFAHATGYKTGCERPGGKGVGYDQATKKLKTDAKYNWRNTAFGQQETHPVVNVSWNDAMAFCKWLTWLEGKTYRLPTEAEWEYACRAGTTTLFYSGDDPESLAKIANVADETAKATFTGWRAIKARDGFVFTAPVGSFRANAFGLFDMHGNVREWCSDWDADDYYARSPEADPPGPSTGTMHTWRGGGWTSSAASCRSASRGAALPSTAGISLGFRIAADPGGPPAQK
ncbi:MAG TPA: SUMF1/EgtB/PvdO family nonheme iron enzyme [Planctomycetaceae bacterium]|jgi:formylglycine-generating enzyme required for sulfatase activity|nr:SUMF1/EgtB/PvdO family nonheme iron enzyme [Planctomycetaceae bacterium]